jgi:hypothetical protein
MTNGSPRKTVLMHNGGSWNAYTIKRCITILCIPKHAEHVTEWCCSLNVAYIKYLIQPFWLICHAWFWLNIILSKSYLFPRQTEWRSFHKFPDFSCSRCAKWMFYSAFVRKCTYMCKHRFGVKLFQNPSLCSSTRKTGLPQGQDQDKKNSLIFFIDRWCKMDCRILVSSSGSKTHFVEISERFWPSAKKPKK